MRLFPQGKGDLSRGGSAVKGGSVNGYCPTVLFNCQFNRTQ
jgi:hypothetical protein